MNSTMRGMQAGLIIVYASSGRTASLVAKYRPKMPVLTLVVPHLKSSALKWELQGRSLARQCLIMRGQSLVLCSTCCVVTLICGRWAAAMNSYPFPTCSAAAFSPSLQTSRLFALSCLYTMFWLLTVSSYHSELTSTSIQFMVI